jgi:hypothetical protein
MLNSSHNYNKENYSPLSQSSSISNISNNSIELEKPKNKLLNNQLKSNIINNQSNQQVVNNIEKALLRKNEKNNYDLKNNNEINVNPLTGKLRNKI